MHDRSDCFPSAVCTNPCTCKMKDMLTELEPTRVDFGGLITLSSTNSRR